MLTEMGESGIDVRQPLMHAKVFTPSKEEFKQSTAGVISEANL
jgi:hypothetical protein